jgi:hypothetical protein
VQIFSLVVRGAAVMLLALAALLLAIDSREYSALSRAGLHALAWGTLPLIAVAIVNLHALDARRGWRWCAAGVNVIVLGLASMRVFRGAPPFYSMVAAVAGLLAIGMTGLLRLDPERR